MEVGIPQGKPKSLWVKENGKSECFNVMLKIEIYISLERGQTSIWSYVTRESEEFLKGGKQMYESSCASTNRIKRWKDIDFVKAEYEVKKLQMRIVKSVQENRYNKAKALQWTLVHSFYARAVAVK